MLPSESEENSVEESYGSQDESSNNSDDSNDNSSDQTDSAEEMLIQTIKEEQMKEKHQKLKNTMIDSDILQ